MRTTVTVTRSRNAGQPFPPNGRTRFHVTCYARTRPYSKPHSTISPLCSAYLRVPERYRPRDLIREGFDHRAARHTFLRTAFSSRTSPDSIKQLVNTGARCAFIRSPLFPAECRTGTVRQRDPIGLDFVHRNHDRHTAAFACWIAFDSSRHHAVVYHSEPRYPLPAATRIEVNAAHSGASVCDHPAASTR